MRPVRIRPVRVLVIDDSITMRNLISLALRRDPDIEVVGLACDPIEGRQAIKTLTPTSSRLTSTCRI
jgi:two-component system, chemotaxis family, protein-glutamate methylesterase/glutaminase